MTRSPANARRRTRPAPSPPPSPPPQSAPPAPPTPASAPPASFPTPWRTLVLVFLGALVVHGLLQWVWFRADVPVTDAWYHARYSWLLGTGGTPWNGLDFPWMTHSAYGDRPVDWSLGWHWLAAPFTLAFAEPIDGMRVACVLFNAVLATVFFWVLQAGGSRRPLLWTLLLHVASPYWLIRIHTCRPTPLAFAGLLLLWHFTTTRRPVALAVTACLTLLLYQVPAMPGAVIGASLLAVAVTERRVPWRLGLFATAGLAAGIVLHPGFWDVRGGAFSLDRGTFALWHLMSESVTFARAAGTYHFPDGALLKVPLPGEMLPIGIDTLLADGGQPVFATAVALWALLFAPRTTRSLSTALLAAGGLALTLSAARVQEYWIPLAILAAAEGLDGAQRKASRVRTFVVVLVGTAAALVSAIGLGQGPSPLALALHAASDRRTREVAPACRALERMAAPGDVVWHGNWFDFAPLFYETRSVRFIQGFDPWYMLARDPQDALALDVLRVPGPLADADIRGTLVHRFGARFALFWRWPVPFQPNMRDTTWEPLIARMRASHWARIVHEDDATVVFEMH